MKTALYIFFFALLLGFVSLMSFQHIGSQRIQALGNAHPYFQQRLAMLSDTLVAEGAKVERKFPASFYRSITADDGIRLRHKEQAVGITMSGPAAALEQSAVLPKRLTNYHLRFAFDRPISLSEYVEVEMNLNAYPDYLENLEFVHAPARKLLPVIICETPLIVDEIKLQGTIAASSVLDVRTESFDISHLKCEEQAGRLSIKGSTNSLDLGSASLEQFDLSQLSVKEVIYLNSDFPKGHKTRLDAPLIKLNYGIDTSFLSKATSLSFVPDTLYHPANAKIEIRTENQDISLEAQNKLVYLIKE